MTRTLDEIVTNDFTYIVIGRTKFGKDLKLHTSGKGDAEFDQIITNQVLRNHADAKFDLTKSFMLSSQILEK